LAPTYLSTQPQPPVPLQLHEIGTSQLGNYVKLGMKLWLIQVNVFKSGLGVQLVTPTLAPISCPNSPPFWVKASKQTKHEKLWTLTLHHAPTKSHAKPKPSPRLVSLMLRLLKNSNMLLISSGSKTQTGLTLSLSTSMTMLHFKSNFFLIQQQMPLSKPE